MFCALQRRGGFIGAPLRDVRFFDADAPSDDRIVEEGVAIGADLPEWRDLFGWRFKEHEPAIRRKVIHGAAEMFEIVPDGVQEEQHIFRILQRRFSSARRFTARPRK